MKVLVDTPIWSYALRSQKAEFDSLVKDFESLIYDHRVIIIGPIRQELLSGYSQRAKFNNLVDKLKHFENAPIKDIDYIQAASFSNTCRSKGIQGSHIDFLICAVAYRLKANIFTTDNDFKYYAKHIPIKLHRQ